MRLLFLAFLFSFYPALRAAPADGRPVTADSCIPAIVYSVDEGLNQSTVYSILQDHRGLIWVGTGGGLQCFDGTRFRSFDVAGTPEDVAAERAVYGISETRPGYLVLATANSLLGFDSRNGEFSLLFRQARSYPELVRTTPAGGLLIRNGAGDVLILYGDSLYPLAGKLPRKGSPAGEAVQTEPVLLSFVTGDARHTDTLKALVRSVYTDRTGNRWFGTDGHGLLVSPATSQSPALARIGFTRCLSLFDGDVWAGTFRNGLWRLSADLQRQQRITPQAFPDSVYIFDLEPAPGHRLWVVTGREVCMIDQNGSLLFRHPVSTSTALFHRLGNGRLLLFLYDELLECSEGDSPALSRVRPQTLVRRIETAGSCYWVASQYGLHRSDTAEGLLPALEFRPVNRITGVPVYSLLEHQGMMLAGTEHGIRVFAMSGKDMPVPGALRELSGEVIYSLLSDGEGRIWYAGSRGTGCFPGGEERIFRYSGLNLQSAEFNFNAYLQAAGRVWFGGIHGVNAFRTSSGPGSAPGTGLQLISLRLSDTAWSAGVSPGRMEIVLGWRKPHLSGAAFAPAALPGGAALYSFLLESYDAEWSAPSADPGFSYRHLPPGQYRLMARIVDPVGITGSPVCLVNVRIDPPYWKTRWFVALCVLAAVVSIVALVRKISGLRYRRKLRDIEHRIAIDRERLRISRDMHDEIGSGLTQVAILSQLVRRQPGNPDEMERLAGRIGEISGRMVDEMGEIIWAMNPQNDNLASFVSYVRRHVLEYLETASVRANLSFPDDPPPVPMSAEQRRNLFLVIKEALHNVVKHAEARRVDFSLDWSGELLTGMIRDDGKGFDASRSPGRGNGLPGMRKRMEEIGGTYSIDSMQGGGTLIRFSAGLLRNEKQHERGIARDTGGA